MNIAVIIRVYDRTEDLVRNLRIISDTWTQNTYYIIVVHNGKANGYDLPSVVEQYADKVVLLSSNAGHRKGNSQLLMEGVKYIPSSCSYTVILEADTWMFGDKLISKYIGLLSKTSKNVWASADWYDKYYALATDFAIIKSDYIKTNEKLFDFDLYPECYVANYLRDNEGGFVWITENMPVHVPSYIKYYYPYVPNIKEGRFYVFPESKIVTHHIEFLKNGMADKEQYFNIITDTDYFQGVGSGNKSWRRFKIRFWITLSKCFVKRSWYSKKRYKEIA